MLWFLIIFYYLDCTKCKFPDFSLTFPNIHFFPWPSTKFPDFSLTFAKSGISLTFPWPLDTLKMDDQASEDLLTHLPPDKMAFLWMKNFVFRLKIHRSLFLRVQLTITQIRAWCHLGNTPLFESMMVSLLKDICATWLQWVNTTRINSLAPGYMPYGITDLGQQSTLIQVMAHCLMEPSHYFLPTLT